MKKLFAAPHAFYPQFATHKAFTLASILALAGERRDFELQRLHGMGETLHAQVVELAEHAVASRIYAPVGSHEHLLAYLVRRLLENGANTSFVNRIADASAPIEDLAADPCSKLAQKQKKPHPGIALPKDLFGAERSNSMGLDLSSVLQRDETKQQLNAVVFPLNGSLSAEKAIYNPADKTQTIGYVHEASTEEVDNALDMGVKAFDHWQAKSVVERTACLNRAAELLEQERVRLIALLVREAGKSIPNAMGEIREAVDFCRYYAAQALSSFTEPLHLPGPTGEDNQIRYQGRGLMICISPWNFPLAIFMGQVVAALVTGNTVIAKPAEQTPLIAQEAVHLLHQAGIPKDVLQLLTGDGETVGARLVKDERIGGVLFTGSTQTARFINQALAARQGAIIPLIAETGGQNAMVVDSSALLEQVVKDMVNSAFDSAGQRCSALRVAFVQEDIAGPLLQMLQGAMAELRVGDPALLETDIGPVIDVTAQQHLLKHIEAMQQLTKRFFYQTPIKADLAAKGTFVPPTVIEIDSLVQLPGEVFGPVLHVIRYAADDLDKVIAAINGTGFGLTFGVHTRIENTVRRLTNQVRAGNCYVNRNMIGAVVGVQPFGGQGLSGTGPKAGGPHYLYRLMGEQVLTVNTTAWG